MKTLLTAETAIGKTITAIAKSDTAIVLHFSDFELESYPASAECLLITADRVRGYDFEDAYAEMRIETDPEIALLSKMAVNLGIATAEELQAWQEKRRAQWEAEAEARKRAEYEKLKAEFEK